jgi:hypothetical protein
MTGHRGPTASLSKGAKRLVAEQVEQVVVVRHHLVFGMHVNPFSNGMSGDKDATHCPEPSGPGSPTRGSTGAMTTRSDQALPPR